MKKTDVLLNLITTVILYCCITSAAFATDQSLDELFMALKNSKGQAEAIELENKIWLSWFESGDKEIDALMQQAMERRRWYDFDAAITILNQVIEKKPDYAEAWNQRATVHFHQQKFEKSLIDIAKTLELEPRHFGAMAGRAVIRMQQLKPALARQNIIQAIKIHPFLKERKMFPGL